MGRWAQRHRVTAKLEARRAEGFSLLASGLTQATVARRLGVTPAAVCQWKRALDRGGRDAFRAIARPGRPPFVSSESMAVLPTLMSQEALKYGISVNLSTIPRILRFVEDQWGVRYTQSAMSRLLRRHGVSRRPPRNSLPEERAIHRGPAP